MLHRKSRASLLEGYTMSNEQQGAWKGATMFFHHWKFRDYAHGRGGGGLNWGAQLLTVIKMDLQSIYHQPVKNHFTSVEDMSKTLS